MSCAALLSCLGVSGWGPLHLLLPRAGEPEALLQRLSQAGRLAAELALEDPRPAHLLACLLRSQVDLQPLGDPRQAHRIAAVRFHHRLVCRRGERLMVLRSWECRAGVRRPWAGGRELRLDAGRLARPLGLASAIPGAPLSRPPQGLGLIGHPMRSDPVAVSGSAPVAGGSAQTIAAGADHAWSRRLPTLLRNESMLPRDA